MWDILVWVNEFVLSFILLCSVLVYIGYTNVDINPWCVGTQQNILPTNNENVVAYTQNRLL